MSDLDRALASPEGPSRTARLAEWVQSLYRKSSRPVLVGGSAVELYTNGAYTSGDLDFAGEVPPEVAKALEASGFVKRGRHWIHEAGQVLIEFPGSRSSDRASTREIVLAGARVLALAPEDLLVDRLSAWKFWRSEVDAINALLLWRSLGTELALRRLRQSAKEAEVDDALEALADFARENRDVNVDSEEVLQWARRAV